MKILNKIKSWFERRRLSGVVKEHMIAFGKLSPEDKEKYVQDGIQQVHNQCKCNCKNKKK